MWLIFYANCAMLRLSNYKIFFTMVHLIYGAVILVLAVLLIIEVRKPKCQCHKKHNDCGGCCGCGHCRDYDED